MLWCILTNNENNDDQQYKQYQRMVSTGIYIPIFLRGGARLHGCTANSITSPVRGYMYIF